jgi:hypothetical protein
MIFRDSGCQHLQAVAGKTVTLGLKDSPAIETQARSPNTTRGLLFAFDNRAEAAQ